MYQYQVIGMRILNFINQKPCSMGDRADFKDNKYEIVLIETGTSKLFTLTGSTTHGWCGSGYRTATWGKLELKEIDSIGSLHYTPLEYIELDEYDIKYHILENDLFYYSENGMDIYYPSGSFEIKLDGWRPTGRLPKKELIHIFYGESCSGKSTLAEMLSEKFVVDSDEYQTENDFYNKLKILPSFDCISEFKKVVVVGNAYKVDLEMVKNILKDHYNSVMVNFDWG